MGKLVVAIQPDCDPGDNAGVLVATESPEAVGVRVGEVDTETVELPVDDTCAPTDKAGVRVTEPVADAAGVRVTVLKRAPDAATAIRAASHTGATSGMRVVLCYIELTTS